MKTANMLLTVIGVGAAVASAVFVSIKTPAFADSFAESGAALPAVTRFFLSSSEGGLQALCVVLVLLLVAKEFAIENVKSKFVVSSLGSLVGLATLIGYFWSMSLPT